MRKLKPGDCGLTKNQQPVCRTKKGLYRFVKRTSAQGRKALAGLTVAARSVVTIKDKKRKARSKGKAKGKGKRAGVPKGYSLMKSHRKGAPVPKGQCFRSKSRLWCRMKGTGRVKQMKKTT